MTGRTVILAVVFFVAVTEGAFYLGCFNERSTTDRLFKGDFQNFTSTNTPEFCVENCRSKGFDYAGVQFQKQCFCSSERPSFEWLAKDEAQCNMPCTGDQDQVCGGHMRMNVYSLVDERPGSLAQSYVGCHPGGALSEEVATGSDPLTLEVCKQLCEMRNYRYFGAERGSQCFCGNIINTERDSEQKCRVPCQGDRTQLCGGSAHLSLYRTSVPEPTFIAPELELDEDRSEPLPYKAEVSQPIDEDQVIESLPDWEPFYSDESLSTEVVTEPPTSPKPVTTARPAMPIKKPKKNKKSSSSSSSSSSSEEKKNKKNKKDKKQSSKNVAINYSAKIMGCYKDEKTKLLSDSMTDLPYRNSPEACVDLCWRMSYKYAGVQGTQCFCSKKKPDKKNETKDKECFIYCPGNASEICGGRKATSVFEIKS